MTIIVCMSAWGEAGIVGEPANEAHERRRRGRRTTLPPESNRIYLCSSRLITITREVLLATGCIGSRIEESTPIDFDAVLGDVLGAAQRTFPTFCLPPDVFVAYLRERLPPDVPPPIALRRMHTSDLYLACACAHCHADAIAVFEDRCLGQLDRVLSRIGIDRDMVAEVKQEIRCRVLVGDGEHAEIAT